MIHQAARRTTSLLLLTFAVILAVAALSRADVQVTDGAGYVATSANVAWAIVATLLLLGLLQLAPLPVPLRGSIRGSTLAAISLHSLGLLAGLYERFAWFDSALHLAFGTGATILAVRSIQALGLFPRREATRATMAYLAVTTGIALAAAWEVFEFLLGHAQGTRLQAGLDDAMIDMVATSSGAALAAWWIARRALVPNPFVPRA